MFSKNSLVLSDNENTAEVKADFTMKYVTIIFVFVQNTSINFVFAFKDKNWIQ